MSPSVATLVEYLPHWQHPSSTRLQALDLLNFCRETSAPLEDPYMYDTLRRGSLDFETEVQQHDAEIEELEKRLNALRRTRSVLECCSETCSSLSKGLKAPIRNVPDDVLVTIFELVCADYPSRSGITYLGKEPMYKLQRRNSLHESAGVCYRWRNLMLGTPSLWTNIRIIGRGEPKSQGSGEEQLRSLTELILRSKLSPLYLTIGNIPSGKRSTFWSKVIDLLEPHVAGRCQSLDLTGEAMPCNTYQPLSSLHSLSIQNPRLRRSTESHDDIPTVHLPVLRVLQLAVCPSKLHFKLGIEWHTLTRLVAANWDLQEVHGILPQCINLEELELSSIEHSDNLQVQVSEAQSSLSSLRLLSLRFLTPNLPELRILQILHLPSLQLLELQSEGEAFDICPLLESLSYCALTSLTIRISLDHLPGIPGILQNYPLLKTLSLDMETPEVFDDANLRIWHPLEALLLEMKAKAALKGPDSTILPQLRELELQVNGSVYLTDEDADDSIGEDLVRKALVDMARSRHDPPFGVARLEVLRVYVDDWEGEELTELEEFEGMEVSLKSR